jgi:hypothetical protein
LISKLRMGDDVMSMETFIQIKWEEIIVPILSTNELENATLETNYTECFYLSVHLHGVYIDDVAPTLLKLVDVKHHASLSSNLLSHNF